MFETSTFQWTKLKQVIFLWFCDYCRGIIQWILKWNLLILSVMYDFSYMVWFCLSFAYVFVSTGPKSFLLFGQKNSLSRLVPDTTDCPDVVLPIHGVKNIKAVEFDPVSQYIYWVRVNLDICNFFYFYKPTECESTPQYKKKNVCEHRTNEVYFLSYGLWTITDNVQRAHLELPC